MARNGRGAHEFIYPGERIEPKVLRIFQKLMQQGLESPDITYGNGTIEQTPTTPVVFAGTPTTIFFKCKDEPEREGKLTLKGIINGEKREWAIDVVEADSRQLPVSILWARERIRDLEDAVDYVVQKGSRQVHRKNGQIIKEIVEVSKKYSILSSLSSFVAVEERAEADKSTGEIVLRKVPILVTVGWHGMERFFAERAIPMRTEELFYSLPCENFQGKSRSFRTGVPEHLEVYGEVSCDRTPAKEDKTDILLAILSLQKAEGGFELTESISEVLHLDFNEIKKMASAIEADGEVDKCMLLSTALLLQVLEICFAHQRDIWAGVVKKSRDWFEHTIENIQPQLEGKALKTWTWEFAQNSGNGF
jgi:Ca-activated chloride channel family protein